MDKTPPTQTPVVSDAPKLRLNLYLILLVIIFILFIGVGGYYLGRTSNNQGQTQNYIQSTEKPCSLEAKVCPDGTTVGRTGPNCEFASCPTTFIQPTSKTQKLDLDSLKKEIQKSSGIEIENIDVSPTDNSLVAYMGPDEEWTKFGIYLYDVTSKTSKVVFEQQESITGRGAYYLDNSALEFSPSGEAFFVNRTGINFPSFFIIDAKGEILYKSDKDLGHATWVNGQQLIYLTSIKENPLIFDINTKKTTNTNLPNNIFHLKANKNGDKIIAFSLPKKELQCENFDLLIYSFPYGSKVKTIPNTSLTVTWLEENSFKYESVTNCEKNPEDSMFEYSPITTEKTEIL